MRNKNEIIRDVVEMLESLAVEGYENTANKIYTLLEQEGKIEIDNFCKCEEPLYTNVSKGTPIYMCGLCNHKIKSLVNGG